MLRGGAEVAGDYSARIHLNEAFGLLPERLFVMSVLPEAALNDKGMDRFNLEPVGTGPFVFQNMIAQDRVELSRNAEYFAEGLPLLDSLTYREAPEASVRMANLVASQSDVMEQAPPESFDIFGNAPGIVAGAGPSTRRAGIMFNRTKAPLSDKRVRQALSFAIDRQAIIDTVLGGKGLPGNGASIPPSMDNFNAGAASADADDRRAKYDQVQAIATEEAVEFILYWPDNLGAWRDNITGYAPPIDDVIDASEIAAS